VLLNAAGALSVLAPWEAPLVDRMRTGLRTAAAAIDDGTAAATLEAWIAVSQRLAGR
jgi:anthranilate phosphoribosyltransferase